MIQMKLTAEQTEELPFPIGCPVWYDFPEKSNGDDEQPEEPPILKQGVVESVSFNYGAKDLVYEVVYKDGTGANTIVEEVSEHNLAYGANCPVTIDSVDGTVLLCESSSTDPSKLLYTVMIDMEGSTARFEVGIDAERIKYRKVNNSAKATVADQTDDPAAASVRKEKSSATNNDPSPAKMSASASAEGTVPSSIVCDSVANSSSKEGGASSSKKREPASHIDSLSTANPNKKSRVDTTTVPREDAQYEQASRSVDNSRRTIGHKKSELVISLPLWLQRNHEAKRNLFFYLVNTKKGHRTVRDVGQETNSRVFVNFNPDRPSDFPMTITVDNCAQHLKRIMYARDHCKAREKIQDLMMDYIDWDRGGAKGRLLYDIAASCRGAHRPNKSTSRVVQIRTPFDDRVTYTTVLNLPCCVNNGTREFHASYLLKSQFLDRLRDAGCSIKICGEPFGIPTELCDPYVLVTGIQWQAVDRGVDILKDAIGKHMRQCSCAISD